MQPPFKNLFKEGHIKLKDNYPGAVFPFPTVQGTIIGSGHIPLKVQLVKFDFDICVHMSKT